MNHNIQLTCIEYILVCHLIQKQQLIMKEMISLATQIDKMRRDKMGVDEVYSKL